MRDNSSVDEFTVPLLDTDNYDNGNNMDSEEEVMSVGNIIDRNQTPKQRGRETITTLSAYPLVSLLTMPLRIMFFVLAYFKQQMEASFIEETANNRFLKSIPQEQKALESDMNHIKDNQKTIGQNIDDLTLRIRALQEKRNKREEALSKWAEKSNEEEKTRR